MPISKDPIVNIVIPVYGKIAYTMRCLASIAENPPNVPFEVIVIDDCSLDDSLIVLKKQVSGLRLIYIRAWFI